MLFVAAIFILPIVGFIAMAFRSNDGVDDRQRRVPRPGRHVAGATSRYSWSQVNGFGPERRAVHALDDRTRCSWRPGERLLAVVAALPAGYAMARLRFRFRRAVLLITLVTMVMPNTVLVIPLFLEVNAIGAVGELWPVR